MDQNIFRFIFAYLITIIIQLYGNPSLPRDIVQNVINYFFEFLNIYLFPCMKQEIINCINTETDKSRLKPKINSIFKDYGCIFNRIDTEHKRFNELKKFGYIDPVEYCIGMVLEEKDSSDGPILEPVYKYGISVPLPDILNRVSTKHFFPFLRIF